MGWLRPRLVPLVLLVTALAVGIALGGGPLSDLGRTPPRAAAEPPKAEATRPAAGTELADAFARGVAGTLYARGLQGRTVAIVTLPGADPAVVRALADQVPAAGGDVLGPVALKRTLVDPEQKTLVDTLGEQLVTQLGDGVVTQDATTYDRAGQLVGRALARSTRKSALPTAKVSSLRASLHGAGLMALPDTADADPVLAPLVLVVTGDEVEQPVLSGLVAGLAAVAKGVVVAGPVGDQEVAALRATPPARAVTTVDGTDVPAGQVATILAVVHSLRSPGGAYGASGADGIVPLG